MRAEPLRLALLDGAKTMPELEAATGYSTERILVELWKLEREGCTFARRQVEYVHLLYDPANPRDRLCCEPGCDVALSHYNPGAYCHYHATCHAQLVLDAMDELWPGTPDPYSDVAETMEAVITP